MRIAIDCRRILDGMSGLGTYTLNLLTAMGLLLKSQRHELTAFVYEKSMPVVKHLSELVNLVVVNWPVENHLQGEYWKHVLLPGILERMQIDVFHDPAYQLPLRRLGSKYVVTIHDLSPFRFPETNTWKYNLYWKFMTSRAIRHADRIIAVSDYVKREIIGMFPGSEDRIDVIPEAAGSEFSPGEVDFCGLKSLGISGRYLLTTAKYEPRKNLTRCIQGFLDGPAREYPDIKLVVVGGMGWKNTETLRLLAEPEAGRHVVVTGYLDSGDLLNVIRGAEAVVVPSVYEGFGLPVLEAMACGTPVICSDAAALPEVGGNAAMYFDPKDSSSIGKVLLEFLNNDEIGRIMRSKGLARSGKFSWALTAGATLEVYRHVLEV